VRLKNDHEALALALYLAASAPSVEGEAKAVKTAKQVAERLTPEEVQKGVVLGVELIAEDPHDLMSGRYRKEENE
jgi:hypothetical protein